MNVKKCASMDHAAPACGRFMQQMLDAHRFLSIAIVVVTFCALCFTPQYSPQAIDVARYSLLTSLMVCASIFDARTHRIPNVLTYTTLICALLLLVQIAWFSDQIESRLVPIDALVAMSLTFLLMFAAWKANSIGGGDVKLVAASAALLGIQRIFASMLISHLVAGLFAAGWYLLATYCRYLRPRWLVNTHHTATIATPSWSTKIPMAGFYAIGTALALWGCGPS